MQKWMQPPACFDHGLHVLKPRSFPQTVLQKCWRDINCSLDYRSWVKNAIQTKIKQHFGIFFHQIKMRQPIGRQDSMQTVIWTSRRFYSFLYESGWELWSLFKYLWVKLKNKKPMAVVSFSRPIQWYHSHVDPIRLDGNFQFFPRGIMFAASRLRFTEKRIPATRLDTQPGHHSQETHATFPFNVKHFL
jgi:hypothetical protein